jgi:hypothetical protein
MDTDSQLTNKKIKVFAYINWRTTHPDLNINLQETQKWSLILLQSNTTDSANCIICYTQSCDPLSLSLSIPRPSLLPTTPVIGNIWTVYVSLSTQFNTSEKQHTSGDCMWHTPLQGKPKHRNKKSEHFKIGEKIRTLERAKISRYMGMQCSFMQILWAPCAIWIDLIQSRKKEIDANLPSQARGGSRWKNGWAFGNKDPSVATRWLAYC